MSNLFKTTTDILRESGMAIINTDDCFADNPELQFNTIINGLEIMDGEFDYIPQMVPVKLIESYNGNKYAMELDNIVKLMESMNCDIDVAMKAVCKENGISFDNAILVIESKQSIAKNAAKTTTKGKKKIMNSIKNIKKKGIKIACKPNINKPSKLVSNTDEGCGSNEACGSSNEGCGSNEACGSSNEGCQNESGIQFI